VVAAWGSGDGGKSGDRSVKENLAKKWGMDSKDLVLCSF
jgi:hypothetical protein